MSHHRRERWYTITQRPLTTGAIKRVYVIACSKCGRQAEQHAGMVTDDMRRKGFQRDGWEIGRWKNLHVCPECAGNAPPPKVEVAIEEPALPEPVAPKTWMDELPKLQVAWTMSYEDEHQAFIAWLRTTYGDRYFPAEAPPADLLEVWSQADDEERAKLLLRLRDRHGPVFFDTRRSPHVEARPTLDIPPTIEQVEPTPSPEAPAKMVDEFLRQVKEAAKTPQVDDSWPQRGTHIDSMPVQAPLPPIENPPAVEQLETPGEPIAEADDDEGAEDWYVELMAKQKRKQERVRK
jgi:hypothetical protein